MCESRYIEVNAKAGGERAAVWRRSVVVMSKMAGATGKPGREAGAGGGGRGELKEELKG